MVFDADVKSAGLGLMLAIALATGSVKAVVEVAMLLFPRSNSSNSDGARMLPSKARAMLDKYFAQQPAYPLHIPARKVPGCYH